MRNLSQYIALIPCLFLPMAAQADTFRCAGHIIEQGMTQDQVLKYCGEPDEMSNQVRISWTYKRKEGDMDIVVYFYANGDIEEIDSVPQ